MLETFRKYALFGNDMLSYLISLTTLLAGFIAIKIFSKVFITRFKQWAGKTASKFDDFVVKVIESIVIPLGCYGIVYLSLNILVLNDIVKRGLAIVTVFVVTFFAAKSFIFFTEYGFSIYWTKRNRGLEFERSIKGILRVVKIVVWGLAVIFFLDNLGFQISSIIAGLGIGGVAVALAAQAVLGDLFSYFSIIFDRPFEIGDFIIIDEYLGTIEYIGIKTTRIRSLSGEQLIFSNTDLTSSRVKNYKRMERRRVAFKIGVTYQTSLENIKAIPILIKDIITNIEDTVFDRSHFFSYGDFSLVFETVYYVLGSDYNKYMDTQQKINFAIKQKFQQKDIEFAYPTQTLYVGKA